MNLLYNFPFDGKDDNETPKDLLIVKKVYDYKSGIDGRRFVVIHHYYNKEDLPAWVCDPELKYAFRDWYCGYMQILPKDKEYEIVKNTADEMAVYEKFPNLDNHAIGGITYAGELPTEPYDSEVYVGFDTNHFNTQGTTLEQAVKATLSMRKDLAK